MLPPRSSQEHVAVGNINIDISFRLDKLPGPEENVKAREHWVGLGGAASNYAIAAARLGQRSLLVARTGREAVALGLIDKLRSEGVDVSHVEVVDEPSGFVVVLLVTGAEAYRSMITARGANAGLRPSMIPERGDVIHFASVAPKIVAGGCGGGRLCTYDPGGEVFSDPGGVLKALRGVDYLFINSSELRALLGDPDPGAATALVGGRLRLVVVKLGGGGAVLVDSAGIIEEAEPPHVEPVDVTGAGDAFDAAFNAWLLWTGDPSKALVAGVAAGAAKVSRRGSSNMPRAGEILSLMGKVRCRSPPTRRG